MDDKELKMNNRTYWFWFGIAVFLLALSFYLGFDFGYDMRDDTKSVDTIIIEKHDTIHLQQFDTITKQIVNYKQVAVHDTIVRNDTIFAVLPFEQLHYHQDSLCDVWLSGYEPKLDSLHIVQRHTTEIVREIVVDREMPMFSVEANARGIFVMDKLVGSIGAEVRYNKPKMTCSVGAAYTTDKKPVFSIGVGYRFDIK